MNDRWRRLLWDAVDEAVIARTDPKEFKKEFRACWQEALKREAEYADKILRREDD